MTSPWCHKGRETYLARNVLPNEVADVIDVEQVKPSGQGPESGLGTPPRFKGASQGKDVRAVCLLRRVRAFPAETSLLLYSYSTF